MVSYTKHYRKAKAGEIKCKDCELYYKPRHEWTRGRCFNKQAVGANHTCDDAAPKEKRGEGN